MNNDWITSIVEAVEQNLQTYLSFTNPLHDTGDFARSWDEIFDGERFGYLDFVALADDGSFANPKGPNAAYKIMRFALLIRQAFKSEEESRQGKALLAFEMESAIPRIRAKSVNDLEGTIWDITTGAEVSGSTSQLLDDSRTWIVDLAMDIEVKLILLTDAFGGYRNQLLELDTP